MFKRKAFTAHILSTETLSLDKISSQMRKNEAK